jgi:hypothetical protein
MADPTGRGGREELITASGMRIVGAATRLVSEAAMAGLAAPEADQLLYAAAFTLRQRMAGQPVVQALGALNEAMRRVRQDYRPLERDRGVTDDFGRLHARDWQVASGPDRWIGELIWRHPHPVQKGQALVTHLVFSEYPGVTTLVVRVGIPGSSPAGFGPVAAGQAHPAFLADLNRVVRLGFDGGDGEPRMLDEHAVDRFVTEVLLSEARELPVVVQAPTERGDYLVPPAQVAEELLGVAHVYVLDRHPTTFSLTDSLGDRRLSCYWGALRAYLPGFTCADNPHEHPLLMDERVTDPVVRAQFRGSLALGQRHRVARPEGVALLRVPEKRISAPAPSPVPARPPESPVAAVTAPAPAPVLPPAALSGLERRLDGVLAALERLSQLTGGLLDEVAGMRATNAVRGATAAGLERRIGDLERWLRERFAPVAEEVGAAEGERAGVPASEEDAREGVRVEEDRLTLPAVVRQAAVAHADVLLILDRAVASAEESPYEDVERVAAVLDAMALVARRRQAGTLGTSLREAFRELGVEYRGGIAESTSERMLQQYQVTLPGGEVVEAREHLALGTSYDPRHCLRIYFTSRVPAEPRFVVGHVGRHFDVKRTT